MAGGIGLLVLQVLFGEAGELGAYVFAQGGEGVCGHGGGRIVRDRLGFRESCKIFCASLGCGRLSSCRNSVGGWRT